MTIMMMGARGGENAATAAAVTDHFHEHGPDLLLHASNV
jgi:hypothetical protein